MSVGVYTTFVAAPPRLLQERPPDPRLLDRAFAVLIIGAIALVVTPDLITYLSVPHEPILPRERPPRPRISHWRNWPAWVAPHSC